MFQEGFLFALIGLFGTFVGVVASLIPTELVAKRDLYQSMANSWQLFNHETSRLGSTCTWNKEQIKKAMQGLKNSDTLILTPAPLTFATGLAAISNGDFVGQAPIDLLQDITAVYLTVGLINDQGNAITLFSQTARENAQFQEELLEYCKSLDANYSTLDSLLAPLRPKIVEQANENLFLARHYNRRIEILKRVALSIFLIAFILMVIFFILQAIPMSEPLPTPTPTP